LQGWRSDRNALFWTDIDSFWKIGIVVVSEKPRLINKPSGVGNRSASLRAGKIIFLAFWRGQRA